MRLSSPASLTVNSRKSKERGGIVIGKHGHATAQLPPSRARTAWIEQCGRHSLYAAGGTICERVVTADGTLDFVEVTRHQTKRDRKPDGSWAFYARHTLTCRSNDNAHVCWEPLTPTQTEEEHTFNRSDYPRVRPPTDPDYSRVYGMRADTESLNAQFERAFYNRRLPAWGLHNQTVIVLMAALAQNAWARHTWQRAIDRQQSPPKPLPDTPRPTHDRKPAEDHKLAREPPPEHQIDRRSRPLDLPDQRPRGSRQGPAGFPQGIPHVPPS
ncbi:MAG: hypothetical protein ABI720_00285 [Actinomycetes bacterium]